MPDLIGFLRARIAEDKEDARAAAVRAESWTFDESRLNAAIVTSAAAWESTAGSGVWDCDDPDDDCGEYRAEMCAEGEHIARWDPARVLAEVAAKRAILDLHEHVPSLDSDRAAGDDGDPGFGCRTCHVQDGEVQSAGWCSTVLALAQPCGGHPDFNPSWRTS